MKKILVPISFSENSKQALRYANKIISETEGIIHMVHCFPPIAYNREYDFGEVSYELGIKKMLIQFYHESIPADRKQKFGQITYAGAVSKIITQISDKYDLFVLSRTVQFQSGKNRFFGDKFSYISSKAKCPVLITTTGMKTIPFTEIKKIWYIQRKEDKEEILSNFLIKWDIDPHTVITKSPQQKTFVSSFWKQLVTYAQSKDNSLLEYLPRYFKDEEIDLLIFENPKMGVFEEFMKADIFQIISQFDIPILILPNIKK